MPENLHFNHVVPEHQIMNEVHSNVVYYIKPNFRTFKVALNPLRRIFLNFAKSCYHADYNSIIKKWGSPSSFLSYKHLKLKLRVFLAGHSVAMVTYCVIKIIPTCSPMIGQFLDTMPVASIDKVWLYASKSKSWNVMETVSSHHKVVAEAESLCMCHTSRTSRGAGGRLKQKRDWVFDRNFKNNPPRVGMPTNVCHHFRGMNSKTTHDLSFF